RDPAGERADNSQIQSTGHGTQGGTAAAIRDLDLPGGESGEQRRRTGHIDRLELNPVLREKSLLTGDPQGTHSGADVGVSEHHLLGRANRGRRSQHTDYTGNKREGLVTHKILSRHAQVIELGSKSSDSCNLI